MTDKLPLTWDEFIRRKEEFIGGDIQWFENGPVFRGPLIGIEKVHDQVRFESPWFAQQTNDGWENRPKAGTATAVYFDQTEPKESENGNITVSMFFHIGCIFTVTIFPKGGEKLDPQKVKGLE